MDFQRYRQIALTPFRPAVEATRGYSLSKLRSDAVAGLTVAAVGVPQSMAYAVIAGVPPEYGLYTIIFQCIVGSLLSSQRYLGLGPINTQSLLVASSVTLVMRSMDQVTPEQTGALYLQLVFALTLLKGLIQMVLAVLKLGTLVRFVSTSVIVGFTAGAGVLIAAKQVSNFLGFSTAGTQSTLPGVLGVFEELLPHLDETHWASVGLGVLTLAVVLVGRKVSRFFPGPLVSVILTAVIVAVVGYSAGDFQLVSPLPEGLPGFHVPWEGLVHWNALISGALALALLGLLEAYSIGSVVASKSGGRVNANQELLSQGLTNFATSFIQCIPGSGSFSRTALNYEAGARTAWAGVLNGVFILIVLLLLADFAKYVPMSCLAGILFVIAFGLIDVRYFKRVLRTSRGDAAVCFCTFAATLLLPLAYAVFAGIVLNIALYLRRSSHLQMNEMVRTPEGPFVERPLKDKRGEQEVVFLQMEGDLFFATAQEMQDRLSALSASGVRVVIMRLRRTHSIDTTVMGVLEQFAQNLSNKGGHLILCGVRSDLMEQISSFGLADTVGRDKVFETRYGVFSSARAALDKARHLLGESIDTEGIEDDRDEPEGWSYQI